jgi:abequosyltransferase
MSITPRLSICIPTYNYGAYIGTALDSVLGQIEPNVEILVLDSDSTDQTREVVAARASRHDCVRYIHQEFRGGIDLDMARSVELSRGEFCWLLSADDALVPGGLRRILAAFANGKRLLLANRWWCDANLEPLRADAWLGGLSGDRSFDFSNSVQLQLFLDHAKSVGALFSFMSCIGFERAGWLAARTDDTLIGSHYAHVQRLFDIGFQGAVLGYLADPLVYCRSGNDSFRSDGLMSRLLIDLCGFMALSQVLFPASIDLQNAFRAVLKREHPPRRWIRAYSELPDTTNWPRVNQLLAGYGYPLWQRRGILLLGGFWRMLRGHA